MKTATPVEIVERLRTALETRNNSDFIEQFAEDGVFEQPFALDSSQLKYEGITKIRERFGASSAMGKLLEIHKVDVVIYESIDPEVVTVEFTMEGKTVATGELFRIPSSVAIIRVRNGKISNYRDYTNTLRGAQVAGMLQQFAASLIK